MKQEFTFVCLGDSLTAGSPGFSGYPGYGGNPQSQYEYWLDQHIKTNFPQMEVEVANFGVGGNVVWQMLYRLNRDVFRLLDRVDYVFIMAGINDLLGHGALPQDVVADLTHLYSVIQSKNAKVVALEVAPCTVTPLYIQRIKDTNKQIAAVAKKMGIPVVPIYAALMDPKNDGLLPEYDIGDGVHFSVAGYRKIGDTVFESVVAGILKKFLK